MARTKRHLRAFVAPSPKRTKTEQSSVSRNTRARAKAVNASLTQLKQQEEDFVRRPAVRLFIPDSLKSILVDDWEKVTKEQKLAQVPSPTPVNQFLNEYYDSEANNRRPGCADADILEEVIAGMREYFNKSLGRILLYRFERQQFYEVHKQIESGHGEHAGKTLCDMYGCEHLLRLFGKSVLRTLPINNRSLTCDHSVNAGSNRAHKHGFSVCESAA